MSELRDMTAVFRAIQASLRDLGVHVAAQDANGEKLRQKLHDLSNAIMTRDLAIDEHFAKANEWMQRFDTTQTGLSDAVKGVQTSLSDHRREIGQRLRKAKSDPKTGQLFEDEEEATQP